MKNKFRGKQYEIEFVKKLPNQDYGLCDKPDKKNPIIKIRSGLLKKELLEVAIHEGLHACFWDLDEEAINESAKSISSLLWKLGYRKIE